MDPLVSTSKRTLGFKALPNPSGKAFGKEGLTTGSEESANDTAPFEAIATTLNINIRNTVNTRFKGLYMGQTPFYSKQIHKSYRRMIID
jgi:hypothetical protein